MKSRTALLAALVVATLSLSARADISMPVKDNFYDKLGRGLANIVLAPTEILDSIYSLDRLEGPTVAWSKGLVQGVSRAVQDTGVGLGETITSPFPVGPNGGYQTWKSTPYDSMVVNEYPPADLTYFY
jgi:putative exosortase-associated protein (TIGR04073 family)